MATSPRREVDQFASGGGRPRPGHQCHRRWGTGFLAGSPRLAGGRGLSCDSGART